MNSDEPLNWLGSRGASSCRRALGAMIHLIVALIFELNVLVLSQGQTPVITIPDGLIKGITKTTIRNNVTYHAYRGIPFAKKPIGDLRFAAPVKNNPWTGVLDATEDKDMCTQTAAGPAVESSETTIIGSEDCLYVNVYTTNVQGRLPVMVWIHGGGFNYGWSGYNASGPDYFLEEDVIYVSFNYRLGIFGFLSTEDSAAPGNWGLKDQVLALKWVKNNIAQFGGDPNKITIFGVSAGAGSVSYLVQSQLTKGLYQGAIMQSGGTFCLWSLTQNARARAFTVGLKLGIVAFTTRSLVENLRRVDYKTLKYMENNVTLQEYLTGNILAGLPFGPVQEPVHDEAVFTGKSWLDVSRGAFQKVNLMTGYTSNEVATLTAYFDAVRPVLVLYELNQDRLVPRDLTQNFFHRLAAGRAIRQHYFGSESILSQPEQMTRFTSVDQFVRPIREYVNQASKYTNVYYYQFSYKGMLGDPNNTFTGVGHGEELYYMFYFPNENRTVNAPDYQTIKRFVTLWTNFAKTGNPTPVNGNSTVLGNVIWEPNNPGTDTKHSIKYLNINTTLEMETNPFQSDWNFYKRFYNRYGSPPYTTY